MRFFVRQGEKFAHLSNTFFCEYGFKKLCGTVLTVPRVFRVFMKKINVKKKRVFIIAGIVLVAVFLCIAADLRLTVTSYTVETNKVKGLIKIALISDLHSCFYGKNQKDLISEINEQNPDIILMSGDIAHDKPPHNGAVKLLDGISGRYKCFYVIGNHEVWSGEADLIKELFQERNITVLEGESKVVEVSGQFINICGVEDPEIGETEFEIQLESAFDSINTDLYTVLLFHRPERFEQIAEYEFDITLSGHAHGGQWRLPYISDGFYSPNQGFFPKYTGGIYCFNGKKMLVSRGLSRMRPPVPRLFNPPELVIINIVPADD